MSFTQSPKSTINFRSKSGYSGIQASVSNWDSLQQKYYSSFEKEYCFGRVNEPLPPKMLSKQFIQSLILQGAEHTGETKRALQNLLYSCLLCALQLISRQAPSVHKQTKVVHPSSPGTFSSFLEQILASTTCPRSACDQPEPTSL